MLVFTAGRHRLFHLIFLQRLLELKKPFEEMNAEHFSSHPDYLKSVASGEVEEGYLEPRGVLDPQAESSALLEENEYFEIDENLQSNIYDDVPMDELYEKQEEMYANM